MRRVKLDEDIMPLSEFRANVASCLNRLQETRRPIVLTQRGHSAAVLVDVAEFERLLDEVELLRDLAQAERQLEGGEGVSHEEARERMRQLTNTP